MEKTKTTESKISVIEQALLKNVIGGNGEISRLNQVECTGK